MVIHDTEWPYRDQVSLSNTKVNSLKTACNYVNTRMYWTCGLCCNENLLWLFFLLMLLCFIAVLIVTCYAHIFFTFIEF